MRGLGVLLALLAAGPAVAWAARRDPNALPPVQVRDLAYGDVLFHYWADEDGGLETLVRLESYTHWGLMSHHAADAQLLAAGLYLQLGMHNEAGSRFEGLLARNLPLGVRNKVWFYLAKIWYERGYYDRSEDALAHIQGKLTPDLESERSNIAVNVVMREGHYDAAIERLRGWRGPPDWMAFARYNLGVALVRAGRLPEADPILSAVGSLRSQDAELLDLRDKANLALGFADMQASKPERARLAFERVRLDGPYSTRALLGAGWAQAELGEYRAALTPWLELHHRDLLDAAVQESYLAVPFAFSKLNAGAQAAQYYEAALKSFSDESGRLDEAIAHVHSGGMLGDLLGADKDASSGWFWQLKTLPDAPQSRYLYTLLADNDFQEGLKNFRDLGYLNASLAHWDQDMQAFGAMIDTREQAYNERLPRTDALLATQAAARLRAERAAAESRLEAIETDDDVVALGTDKQRAQWDRIARDEERAAAMPPGLERDEAQAKLRLIKGVLYWQLEQSFKARSYAQHRELRTLDHALEELQNRWVRVQRARAAVPADTGDFAASIAALGDRMKAVHTALASISQQQSGYLEQLAEGELKAQQQRLAAYAVQARFSLADLYDRGGNRTAANASTHAAPDTDAHEAPTATPQPAPAAATAAPPPAAAPPSP
jgi:hypothetical protein